METHKVATYFLSFTAVLGREGPGVGHGRGLHKTGSNNSWDGDDGVVGQDQAG